ncbi:hypothetical protein [Cupriavidus necator]|uniref:hypothetical protein n=1 Tax=Cupriavidus necator TaxID=106590 RepID=UPI0030F4A6AA
MRWRRNAQVKEVRHEAIFLAGNSRQQLIDLQGYLPDHRPETRIAARERYPGKLHQNQGVSALAG